MSDFAARIVALELELAEKTARIRELLVEVARLTREEDGGSLALTNRRRLPKDFCRAPDFASAEFYAEGPLFGVDPQERP
jgi:hypothetical protein